MLSHEEYSRLYTRSEELQLRKGGTGSTYSEADHRKWCDRHNSGVTSYGIHTSKLSIEDILMDVFHLRSGVSRKLLHYFQHQLDILAVDYTPLQPFFQYFDILWKSTYFSSQFTLNKPLLRIQGKHVVDWLNGMENFIG